MVVNNRGILRKTTQYILARVVVANDGRESQVGTIKQSFYYSDALQCYNQFIIQNKKTSHTLIGGNLGYASLKSFIFNRCLRIRV